MTTPTVDPKAAPNHLVVPVDPEALKAEKSSVDVVSDDSSHSHEDDNLVNVPLMFKLGAILMVSAIGFGSHWSSGVTGAMKTTLKKELHINNKQYALLEASQDFMVTLLVLVSGVVTDRIGGASMGTCSYLSKSLMLTTTRCDTLRQRDLQYWIYLDRCRNNSPILEVYDCWRSRIIVG